MIWAFIAKIATAVTATCKPGFHPRDVYLRRGHFVWCYPDVPGAGLPWDWPNLISFIGLCVLGGIALICSIVIIVKELARERKCQ